MCRQNFDLFFFQFKLLMHDHSINLYEYKYNVHVYSRFIYFRVYQFLWIEKKLVFSLIFDFLVFPMSAYNLIEHLYCVEHLNSWFICTDEIHENLYPRKIMNPQYLSHMLHTFVNILICILSYLIISCRE